ACRVPLYEQTSPEAPVLPPFALVAPPPLAPVPSAMIAGLQAVNARTVERVKDEINTKRSVISGLLNHGCEVAGQTFEKSTVLEAGQRTPSRSWRTRLSYRLPFAWVSSASPRARASSRRRRASTATISRSIPSLPAGKRDACVSVRASASAGLAPSAARARSSRAASSAS